MLWYTRGGSDWPSSGPASPNHCSRYKRRARDRARRGGRPSASCRARSAVCSSARHSGSPQMCRHAAGPPAITHHNTRHDMTRHDMTSVRVRQRRRTSSTHEDNTYMYCTEEWVLFFHQLHRGRGVRCSGVLATHTYTLTHTLLQLPVAQQSLERGGRQRTHLLTRSTRTHMEVRARHLTVHK
jgi:hypothetical protein